MLSALGGAALVVAPVALVLALGHVFGRWARLTREEMRGLGRVSFWIGLPSLIARDIVRAPAEGLFDVRLGLGTCVVLVAVGAAAYGYARRIPDERIHAGVLAQAAFRSNMMYIGLPVILYQVASDAQAAGGPVEAAVKAASALTALTLSVAVPALNVCSILFLSLSAHGELGGRGRAMAQTVLANPLILAALSGLMVRELGLASRLGPGTALGRTLDLIAAGALPTALLAVGAALDPGRVTRHWRRSAWVATTKLVLMPAAGLALFWTLGLRGVALIVGTVLLACPTAATSQAMVIVIGGDEDLASDLVAVTTLLCPLTLVLWLSVLQFVA